jgi:hypothetical protein
LDRFCGSSADGHRRTDFKWSPAVGITDCRSILVPNAQPVGYYPKNGDRARSSRRLGALFVWVDTHFSVIARLDRAIQ